MTHFMKTQAFQATGALLLVALLAACGGKEESGQELTLLGAASAAATNSTCAGGSPELAVTNSTSRSSNVYIFYSATNCTGTTLATTTALNNGATSGSTCVAGTNVGVKDINGTGVCKQLTLFQGAKQSVSHTLDGATDVYTVTKASSFLGLGGF